MHATRLSRILWKITAATLAASFAIGVLAFESHAKEKRSKVIDFDDEVVEGMNRRPLDSLSQISEKDKKRRKAHLYRKRAGFRTETSETLRALRFTP